MKKVKVCTECQEQEKYTKPTCCMCYTPGSGHMFHCWGKMICENCQSVIAKYWIRDNVL